MYKCLISLCFLFAGYKPYAQRITGIIIDSLTKKHLSFASIRMEDTRTGFLTDINGRYSINISGLNGASKFLFSYTGYKSKEMTADEIKNIDTIRLSRNATVLKDIVIASNSGKIKRIINNAVAHKPINNPDNYNSYECNVYYKMKVGFNNFPFSSLHPDSASNKKIRDTTSEPIPDFFTEKSYLMFSESYSKRLYKKPQQLNETVLASRFSGLKKSYFMNTITEVLPFHVYNDYIKLNEVDYLNPISKGWENKYHFILEEELYSEHDTTYIFSFTPKPRVIFNGLQGEVYINKNGYAISHMIAAISDTSKDWTISFEQLYTKNENRWFPKELNYNFKVRKMFSGTTEMYINGHSIIDSIKINQPFTIRFDRSHPLKMADSIDLHSESEWARMRMDSLSMREANTYTVIDSFSNKHHLEQIINTTTKLSLNKFSIGKYDIDISRLYRSNEYEGSRVGFGLNTNNKVSKLFSAGGWFAYGFKDEKFKGGANVTFYPKKEKDNWIQITAEHDYRKAGDVHYFEDLEKKNGVKWVLRNPDELTTIKLSAQIQSGYTQINPEIINTNLKAYPYHLFNYNGNKHQLFTSFETNIGLRYAYGEKRIPVMDYYIPMDTKFPILYTRFTYANIVSDSYKANYLKWVNAITYKHHFMRWGLDQIKIEGGFIYELNQQPMPRSFLIAANGIRTKAFAYYFQDGFATMAPNLYFTDRFMNIFYRHDLNKFLWQIKDSKPYISLLHNLGIGRLSNASLTANEGIITYQQPYNESGLMINQLYKYNFHFSEIGFNVGGFYHWWGKPDISKNVTLVLSAGIAL